MRAFSSSNGTRGALKGWRHCEECSRIKIFLYLITCYLAGTNLTFSVTSRISEALPELTSVLQVHYGTVSIQRALSESWIEFLYDDIPSSSVIIMPVCVEEASLLRVSRTVKD